MTQMSESNPDDTLERDVNPARSLDRSALARTLHDLARVRAWVAIKLRTAFGGAARPTFAGLAIELAGLAIAFASGCVIPPSLSVDSQDAGVNSPPAIVSVFADQTPLFESDSPVFARGAGQLSVSLLDTDLDDTLFVRVYVNYTIKTPTPSRASCTAAPNHSPSRSCTANLQGLCMPGDVGVATPLDMTVLVFDRELLDEGTPVFQAMPNGGLTTSKFFHLSCVEPQ
jgi:hypothetical protein